MSDYARARRIKDWLGVVACGAGLAPVLSGDAGPVAWFPRTPEHGHLVQWIAADSEESIEAAIRNLHMGSRSPNGDAEEIAVTTGPSGRMHLFDAALAGDDTKGEAEVLHLLPGRYTVRAWCLRSDRLTLVTRQVIRMGSV
jgi:Immunity protein 21